MHYSQRQVGLLQLGTVWSFSVTNIQSVTCTELSSLARVVLQQSKRSHVMPLVKSLHWLPVAQRNQYKLAVLTYKFGATSEPQYLGNMLSSRCTSSTMSLRSSTRPQFGLCRHRTAYGSRAFRVAAPKTWNNLPADVTACDTVHSLRKHWKSVIFSEAFSDSWPTTTCRRLCSLV